MKAAVGTMAAALVSAPGEARVVRMPVPEPGPVDVLVRIEGCGVCASSLPLWVGRPWFSYPLEPGVPGHEGWGVVEAVGEDVESLDPGERVALLSHRAFAEFDVARAEHCVALPNEGPWPGEAVACALNVLRRACIYAGQRVAIVGVGFLGSLLAELCRRSGATVVGFRRGDDAGGRFERVIECAGTQAALDTASGLVAERGRLVIAGFHQDGRRTIDLQSWNWRGIEVVNAHERDPAVYVEAMREATQMDLDLGPFLTHRFPLHRLGEAFEAARSRPAGFLKAWVEP
jgi:threonine dehydrogenase-like Zn-dependent dehydrogenase